MLNGLNHITLAVKDLSESLAFYQRLGFEAEVRWDAGAYLSMKDIWLCLSKGEVDPGKDYSHIAFSTKESDFESLMLTIKELGLQEWQENSSEGKSLYLLDPNGHKLEIHVGSLESRLSELKEKPYKGLVWLK